MDGKLIMKKILTSHQVDLENTENGTYLAILKSYNIVYKSKIIILE